MLKIIQVNDDDPKFKVVDQVRISKYKNIFAKDYTPNWSEEVLVMSEIKIQFHGHMLLMISKIKPKQIQNRKSNQKKETSYMSNGKDMKMHFIVGTIKKTQYK